MFTETANKIFNRAIGDYHRWDDVDHPIENPYEPGSLEHLLYHKNWIDTVQWHLEDIIRDPQIDPVPALRRCRPNPMGEKTGTWIGFSPFSAQQGKTYPTALGREAVRLLAERYDRVFIHSGGGAEAEFAREMERAYPNVTALFGRVGIDGELDLIANLDCVVAMDSLVMHMASLVATPVVSVWGATHPGLGFFGYGCDPRGILQADMECRPCSVFGNKPCRYGDYRCLYAVTPAMIAERVAEMVGE